jgi:hypothetical protein
MCSKVRNIIKKIIFQLPMAANYSTLEIERLDGLDENDEQIRMDADYSIVETERLDENGKNEGKNGLNFLRLVLMPLLFVLDSSMRQFGVGLMDVDGSKHLETDCRKINN